ncbi:unnamed protein product [Rhodiola kirilowii]
MVNPSAAGSVGWRFSPKDEELINYFLARKINGKEDDVKVIREIDVCKWEPWDLPDQSMLKSDDKEWFFFCPRDQKFPSSSRLNRATCKGFWKSTGKDRKIRRKKNEIGIKKTLVFHTGRAPKSQRTYWVMHEYRATSKELDGTHPGQRPFVLCRLFKKDDDFVPDATENDVELATLSPISNEHSPVYSKPELVSQQIDPYAGKECNEKFFSPENCNNERCKTPYQDTLYDTECRVEDHPTDAEDLEDIMKSIQSERQPQTDAFDYPELFADPNPNDISLFDSPMPESMGSSLPDHSATNYSFGNEDLQLGCDILKDDDYTYLQSLFSNSPDNSFQDQGNNQISVDYEILKANNIPSMDSEEAELSEMVAEVEQYALFWSEESNDPSQASNSQIVASGWTSFQELDESQTHSRGGSFSDDSVMEQCVKQCGNSDDQVSSSQTNLSKPDLVAHSGIQIQRRQPQVAPATDNNDKHGTAQRRINLQTNLSRGGITYEYELQSGRESPKSKEDSQKVTYEYELQCDDSGRESPKSKEDNQKVYKKFISWVSYPFQPSRSYKLIIGLASIVTIFAAYAVIRGR